MNNARYFFAVLIGLAVGFLAGLLTANQWFTPAARPAPAAAGAPQQPSRTALPEGHPPIDFQKELDSLQQFLKEHPGDFNALSQMGNILYDMGRFNEAVTWYEKALEVQPDDPNVRTDLGTCLHYVGQHQRAVQEFEAVLARHPDFTHALHNLGVVRQLGFKDSQGAIAAWEKLLEVDPNYPSASRVRENIAKLKAGKEL